MGGGKVGALDPASSSEAAKHETRQVLTERGMSVFLSQALNYRQRRVVVWLVAFVWSTGMCAGAADDDLGFGYAGSMGGTSTDLGQSTAVDAVGNVYVAGRFSFTADFDPGAGTVNLTSAGGFDLYVYKLNPGRNLVWARAMGGPGIDVGMGIAVDDSGNVYTTGCFTGTADFDPGPGTANLTSAGGEFDADVFVSKLDSNGNYAWAKQLGGVNSDWAEGIALDDSGNVYSTGSFFATGDFDPSGGTATLTSGGGDDAYVSKLDSDGNFVWAGAMGGPGSDAGSDIVVDALGGVYTTGFFSGTGDFDPSGATANLISAGSNDIFVSKLDSGGNFVWAGAMGGSSTDNGLGIAVDSTGNVYTTGSFEGTADFNPGGGTANLNGAGGTDIFVSKLDSGGSYVWAGRMGGPSADVGEGIAVDSAGEVYTTGFFRGEADFDPAPPDTPLYSVGDSDIFVSQLDTAGNFIHAKGMGGTGTDVGKGIVVDGAGSVYTTGFFSDTADLDPRAFNIMLTSAGGVDVFASKLIVTAPLGPVANLFALVLLSIILLVAGSLALKWRGPVRGGG